MNNNLAVTVRKALLMLIGLFLSAVGVSFSIKAEIGTSPISCCPAVFSESLQLSIGMAMWLMCCLFLAAQIIILKKEFPLFQLLQLVVAFLFGYLTDFTNSLMSMLAAETIFKKVLYCVLGIIFLAVGVFALLKADLLMLSPDATLAVISKKYGFEYGRLKTIMDCSLVCIAAVGSLLIYHRLVNIGVGTLAAALFVGMVIRKLKQWNWLNDMLNRVIQ